MKEKYINTKYGKVFLRIDNEKCKEKTIILLQLKVHKFQNMNYIKMLKFVFQKL